MAGLFITFEGGDGVGKSTQSELLCEWLQVKGHNVVVTREPGATELGLKIRNLLLHESGTVDPKAEALLYAADRAHHISTVVRPALEQGSVVVQDRYIDSSIAYQGAGRVLNADDVSQISQWATDGLKPDLTILLDLDVKTATRRRDERGESADRIESEKLEFHERVRQGFLELAHQNPERILICDASLDVQELASQIKARVETLL